MTRLAVSIRHTSCGYSLYAGARLVCAGFPTHAEAVSWIESQGWIIVADDGPAPLRPIHRETVILS